MRAVSTVCLVLCLVFACSSAFAHELGPQIEPATPGVAPTGPEDPLFGEIIPEIEPFHFHITPHIHTVDDIYSRYDGYRERGEQGSGYNPGPTTAVLKFTINRTVANGWSVNIGFSKDPVEAKVGYSVTWSEGRSWGWDVTTPANTTAHVGYQDWYHVQRYNCHTTYYPPSVPPLVEYGQGWAEQWFKPHFYHWFTPGNSP